MQSPRTAAAEGLDSVMMLCRRIGLQSCQVETRRLCCREFCNHVEGGLPHDYFFKRMIAELPALLAPGALVFTGRVLREIVGVEDFGQPHQDFRNIHSEIKMFDAQELFSDEEHPKPES